MQNVLLLGGYGCTGRILAELLLRTQPGVNVTIAGRHVGKAEQLAGTLARQFPERVDAMGVDAARPESLTPALRGMQLMVVAASTAPHMQTVVRSALSAGADCYDIMYSPEKLATLRLMAGEIERADRCFITDGGFHPGLPALLVRRLATELGQLESAHVGSIIQQDWRQLDPGADSWNELLDMIGNYDASLLIDGEWRNLAWHDASIRRQIEFAEPFGRRSCYAMALEEMRLLPSLYPTLRSGGFYVAGFNPLVDWGVIPLAILARRVAPVRSRPALARLLESGLRRGSRPPFRTVLRAEAGGRGHGELQQCVLEVSHQDGYYLTAACVAAGVRQLLDGAARQPGVQLQAHAMEPTGFLADLEQMGVDVVEQVTHPVPAGAI